jgi:hypothetical protein
MSVLGVIIPPLRILTKENDALRIPFESGTQSGGFRQHLPASIFLDARERVVFSIEVGEILLQEFREKLRARAQTLEVSERQKILRWKSARYLMVQSPPATST